MLPHYEVADGATVNRVRAAAPPSVHRSCQTICGWRGLVKRSTDCAASDRALFDGLHVDCERCTATHSRGRAHFALRYLSDLTPPTSRRARGTPIDPARRS